MAVKITPRGTRGQTMPHLPGPLNQLFWGAVYVTCRLQRMPLIHVTTQGAKTGRRRATYLRRFDVDGNSWMVVASLGGAVHHPSWYFNMARNPDHVWVQMDGREVRVTPTSLHGAERDSAWTRVVAEAPAYAGYQTKTDREIPVVVLRRAS